MKRQHVAKFILVLFFIKDAAKHARKKKASSSAWVSTLVSGSAILLLPGQVPSVSHTCV